MSKNPVDIIMSRFKKENLYSNYGHLLKSITIDGFRGINNLEVNFEFPITAISGTNGAGKSTIAQICVCGYKSISTEKLYKRYYIKDFFPMSIVDPSPFT